MYDVGVSRVQVRIRTYSHMYLLYSYTPSTLYRLNPNNDRLKAFSIGTGMVKMDWASQILQVRHQAFVTGFMAEPLQLLKLSQASSSSYKVE